MIKPILINSHNIYNSHKEIITVSYCSKKIYVFWVFIEKCISLIGLNQWYFIIYDRLVLITDREDIDFYVYDMIRLQINHLKSLFYEIE